MGLQDRDYMRTARGVGGALGLFSTLRGKVIAGLVVAAVVGGLLWFQHRSPAEGSLLVNINTATEQQIETLPGIGPALAARIIQGRPYVTVADIEKVQGVGPKTAKRLAAYVKVEGNTEKRR